MWNRVTKLVCGVQHYPWGERSSAGRVPYIADLLGETPGPDEPFAELWVGAHPKLPASVRGDDGDIPLDLAIAAAPEEILGPRLVELGYSALPFLLKILSCERPLSIQAHPDIELARRLHARDPEHYPDANHKPEIAIALTPFRALSQFRHVSEITSDVVRIPALGTLFDGLPDAADPAWLRAAYSRLFDAPQADIIQAIDSTIDCLAQNESKASEQDLCFLELNRISPGDRGTLSAYFLNYIELQPGEAFFMSANEPHAYLEGTIVECMANSDNVVRAGMTPKFIDRDVLVDMLTYRQGCPVVWAGEKRSASAVCYRVPTPEFEVEIYSLDPGQFVSLSSDDMVSLLLVLDGNGVIQTSGSEDTAFCRGTAWLLPAAAGDIRLEATDKACRIIRARPNPPPAATS